MSNSSPEGRQLTFWKLVCRLASLQLDQEKRKNRGKKEGRGKWDKGRELNDFSSKPFHFIFQVYTGNIFLKVLGFFFGYDPFILFSEIPWQFPTGYVILLPF